MSNVLKTARLAVPVLFFGYGIFANFTLLTGQRIDLTLPESGLLSGGLTRDIDGLYKKDLPHMDTSFGLIGAARYELLGEARQGAVVGTDGWLYTSEEARAVPDQRKLAAIVATVRDVRVQLLKRGSDLVVVPLPAKIDIYRNHSPNPAFGTALADLYADFSAQLTTQGVPVVDARGALLGASVQTFLATDTHWTPQGAALVAAAIATSGTVAPGPLKFARSDGQSIAHVGDLIKFVTTDALAPGIGLAPEKVTTVVQTPIGDASTDIFGSAGPDIILVGTSYSANPDWGFADALMRELGRDVVSMAESGFGPLQPMQHYLASAEARETPAAVVVWEIPIRYLTDPAVWPEGAAAGPTVAGLSKQGNPDG